MLQLQLFEGGRQRLQVQAGAFGGERFAATFGFQRLAVEVIHAGALDIAGARRLGGFAAVRFPALLPVRQCGLGLTQRVLTHHVVLAQLLQLRFGVGHGFAQHRQTGLVAADVLAQFLQGMVGLVARLLQALGQFALVLDLLFDAGQRAADLVDLALRLVEGVGGFLAAHAVGFQQALGFALFGDQLLQLRFFL